MNEHTVIICIPYPISAHVPQVVIGLLEQLRSTYRERSSHRIKVADDVAIATVTTNPISVAQRYLSQLTASVP